MVDPADLYVSVDSDPYQCPDTVYDKEVKHWPTHIGMEHSEGVGRLHAGYQNQKAVGEEEEDEDPNIIDGLRKKIDASRAFHRLFLPDDHRQDVSDEAQHNKGRATVSTGDEVQLLSSGHDLMIMTLV